MLIECLIEREGSTTVMVAGFTYEFVPNAAGHRVCDVLSSDHQGWFLSLPRFYRKYEAGEVIGSPDKTPVEAEAKRPGRPRKV